MEGYCRNCDCFYVLQDKHEDDVLKDGQDEWFCPVCWDILFSDMAGNTLSET